MGQLSKKVSGIKPSITLAVSAKAIALKMQGCDIIDLGVGEPDFDTPDFIKEAAIKAIRNGFTKYTAVDGISSLKQAIIEKFARENQLVYQTNQIIVSCGAKHSLFNAFNALLNPGDEVIIPAPYWVSYPDMVVLADGIPIFVATNAEQRFKMSAEQLQAAITPKTRLVILNSPSNPSGMAYSRQELQALGAILMENPNVIVVTDDIYEHIFWGKEPFVNIVNVCPELYDRTIVVNGVSKAYAMTGWRIGYAAGDAKIIAVMRNMQSQSTSNPNSIAQVAAETALRGNQSFLQERVTKFKNRHDFLVPNINHIPGMRCMAADGTFYAFVSVEALLEKSRLENDVALSEYLLEEAQVAVVPGSGFGMLGYIRLSYATSMEQLKIALERIVLAVEKLLHNP